MPLADHQLPRGVAILGAGATGCLLAARLVRRRTPVTLVGDPSAVADIRAQGLTCEQAFSRTVVVRDLEAVSTWSELDHLELANLGLIVSTTGVQDIAQAVSTLASALPTEIPLLLLQSGVDGTTIALDHAGKRPVLAGVTTCLATQPRPTIVRNLHRRGGVGLATVTAPRATLLRIANQFAASGFPTHIYSDHQALVWSKLLLDLPGNAVPAIVGLASRRVFADLALCRLEIAAFREALAVMRAQGLAPVDLPGYPVRLLARVLEALPLTVLHRLLPHVPIGIRGGRSWLQTDLEQGRMASEVQDLNGAVVRAGVELGVAVPANALISRTVAAMLKGDIPRDAYRTNPHRLLSPLR